MNFDFCVFKSFSVASRHFRPASETPFERWVIVALFSLHTGMGRETDVWSLAIRIMNKRGIRQLEELRDKILEVLSKCDTILRITFLN